MRTGYCLGIIFLMLVAGTMVAKAEEPVTAPHPVIEGKVRFDLYQNYLIVVHGSAGNATGLNLLVDTGASSSVLDPRVARSKLHLQQEPASLRVVGGRVAATLATVPTVRVGPAEKQNVSVFVEDLSFLQPVIPVRIDGIVGLDVLGQGAFVIDYRRHSIDFGSLPALPDAVPLVMRGGLGFVQAAVNGVPAMLLVDTGAPMLTMFVGQGRNTAADRTVAATQGRPRDIGQFAHRQVTLPSLRLGSAEFARQPLSIVSGGATPDQTFDGLLSPVALGMTRVAIDRDRGIVAFVR